MNTRQPPQDMKPPPTGRHRTGPSSYQADTASRVLDALGVVPGCVFVDLGCGPGDYALDAGRLIGSGGAVLALDTWSRMLHELRLEAVNQDLAATLPLHADITAPLPVATHRADACLLAMVLHMPGRAAQLGPLLDELRRVLKPGGRLGILEHAGHDRLPASHQARRLTPDQLTAKAGEHGFSRRELLELNRAWLLVLTAQAAASVSNLNSSSTA